MNDRKLCNTVKRWDAGDAGCGRLIVALQQQLMSVPSGELLEVVARNAGAPLDVPSWCRVTGNQLVAANHPVYVIRKKSD